MKPLGTPVHAADLMLLIDHARDGITGEMRQAKARLRGRGRRSTYLLLQATQQIRGLLLAIVVCEVERRPAVDIPRGLACAVFNEKRDRLDETDAGSLM